MALRVALHHVTEYRYDRPVYFTPHTIRLRPAPHCRTPVLSYSVRILPVEQFLNWQQDPYSNYLARLVFPEPSDRLRVEVDLVADMTVIDPFDFFVEEYAESYPFAYEATLQKDLTPYLQIEATPSPLLVELAESQRVERKRSVDYLVQLNKAVQDRVGYRIRMEPGIQTCQETLETASGSCRDSAWVLVQLLRHLGFAARFTSGYLIQLKPDVESLDGPVGSDTDFTDLHAWTEVYLPGAGWIGLDATSGLLAGEGHLPLACAADPLSAAPISGTYLGEKAKEEFTFEMSLTRIAQAPRVTLPYDDQQWSAILALGDKVEEMLVEQDVRLSMGGEPTFVSIDDMDGDEWNVTALGHDKRRIAGHLLRRLAERFAHKPLLFYGQGKLYPGESLPRWALSCFWRHDGQSLWDHPELLAQEDQDYGHGQEQAEKLMRAIAGQLGLDEASVRAAYEDSIYFMWRERQLPFNVQATDNRLADPEERERLARVFGQGLGQVVGFAIATTCREGNWVGAPLQLRGQELVLIPGDSPMGYRLPLDSLPWVEPKQQLSTEPADPMQPPRGPVEPLPTPIPAEKVRTALCVQARGGKLYIFVPPLRELDDFLDLVAACQRAVLELGYPVLFEGYSPGYDARLERFSVTPDPGVIEVNIHPSRNWKELVERTEAVYAQARLCRLGTEKFMLDGRHTGTGGGNHIVMGGLTPADSPFLRRPDLLRSLVSYWVNHPSLSYLFSGLFVGPTSQAPRLDEARNDSLYELELAFRHLPNQGEEAVPWIVDRVLRNLLVDSTGNTHRSEFCIDKLYSPDTSSGRLGLLEMRSFEMPPHQRMSLTQQLLLRSMIATFWNRPYRAQLVHWGTELHDRFMLGHYVRRDFMAVLEDLAGQGVEMSWDWFEPHYEFRFPRLGEFVLDDLRVTLRQAIEPWHVLGEEPGMGGAVRFVDSSLERIEVTVEGMTDSRHQITCNGRLLPLRATGRNGEFVAGVRYRAWQPPNCLHPTIPVHVPLIFDVHDRWSQRSLGGCSYNVAHPGGRSYETFPVNSYEAEARRRARFFSFGHTPGGPHPLVEEPPIPGRMVHTLDLRW